MPLYKTQTTSSNKVFKQLQWDAVLFISATIMSNHVRDIAGYLRLIWNDAWPFAYSDLDTAPAAHFDEDAWQVLRGGLGHGGVTRERLFDGGIRTTRPDDQLSERDLRARREYGDCSGAWASRCTCSTPPYSRGSPSTPSTVWRCRSWPSDPSSAAAASPRERLFSPDK